MLAPVRTTQPITIGSNDAGFPRPLAQPLIPSMDNLPEYGQTMPYGDTQSFQPVNTGVAPPQMQANYGIQQNQPSHNPEFRGARGLNRFQQSGQQAPAQPGDMNQASPMPKPGFLGMNAGTNTPLLPTSTSTTPSPSVPSPFPPMQPNTPLIPPAGSAGTPTTPIQNYAPVQSPAITPMTPSYGVNQNTNVGSVNGVDSVRVNPTSLDGYQPFIDSAYNQSASRLDPQFAQRDRQFEQQMVNQGLTAGTQAYDDARGNFNRDREDAYSSARNNAMGQGLAAQGQAFGQGAQQAGLAQNMRQWNDQFRLNQDNADLGAYGTLAGIDMAAYGLNQNANQQQFNNVQSMLGMIPNMSPNGVDVNGIYGLRQSGQQANAQAAGQANNGMWNAVGQIGGALISSEEIKDKQGPLDPEICLKAMCALPVDMWNYTGDPELHFGTYSEQFYNAFGMEGRGKIDLVDMMGALHGAIQALAKRAQQ